MPAVQPEVVLWFLLVPDKQFPEPVMPWIGTFYNPPPFLSTTTMFLLLTLVPDMWYVPSLDNLPFYFWKIIPLSRHRFCFFIFGLLSTALSSVLMAAFMSWVLAAVMTTDNGMPFLSVSRCLFVPNLPLSVGFGPVLSPLMAPWLMRYLETATSTWYLWFHRISLVTWPTVSGTLLFWPTLETFYGR